MFFGKIDDIAKIAKNVGASIFVVPGEMRVDLRNSFLLEPVGKSVITIEQVRGIMGKISMKQTNDIYIVIRPAEQLGEEAANALLKQLEEPREGVHFVLITDNPSQILPTILSRAALYYLNTRWQLDSEIVGSDKDKMLAKKLMVAKADELVDIAEEIGKKKEGVRAYAMNVLGIAIEMLYKTYLITGKEVFLKKIPNFLQAYDGIRRNGHVKLQIVSNLC